MVQCYMSVVQWYMSMVQCSDIEYGGVRRAAGGVWQMGCGGWRAAGGVRRMACGRWRTYVLFRLEMGARVQIEGPRAVSTRLGAVATAIARVVLVHTAACDTIVPALLAQS